MSMTGIDSVHQANAQICRPIERMLAGDEVAIVQNKEPVAGSVREAPATKTPLLGAFKGQFDVDASAFAPMSDNALKHWGLV